MVRSRLGAERTDLGLGCYNPPWKTLNNSWHT